MWTVSCQSFLLTVALCRLEMDDLDSDEDEDKVIASENSSSAVSSSSSTHVEPSTSYDSINDNNDMDASATRSEGHLNKDKHTKGDKTKDVHGEAEVTQGTCTSKEEEQPDNKCGVEKQDSERLSHDKVCVNFANNYYYGLLKPSYIALGKNGEHTKSLR